MGGTQCDRAAECRELCARPIAQCGVDRQKAQRPGTGGYCGAAHAGIKTEVTPARGV